MHGTVQPRNVTNVSDEVAEAWLIEPRLPHLMLLQLITTEDDQLSWPVIPEHHFGELPAERPRTAGHENRRVFESHVHRASQDSRVSRRMCHPSVAASA